ncbi:hypothetical protein ACOSQ2_007238 [Xanthoceras sorbifolium]
MTSATQVFGLLFTTFIGDAQLVDKQKKQEFFDMKCCSLKRKDLNHHYKKIFKDNFASTRRNLANITLGEIHQMTLASLEKLCDTQKFFSKMIQNKKKFERVC